MDLLSELLKEKEKPEEPPPLTKAEKKKQKKLEMKIKTEAKMRKAKEVQMTKEINVAKKNINSFRTRWKEIQMKKARVEYNDYMNEHWVLFDQAITKKDNLIKILEHELEMAENIRLWSHMDHAVTLNNMVQDYNNIMDDIRSQMLTSKCKLLDDNEMNIVAFNEDTERLDENMRLVLFLLDGKKKEDYLVWGGEFVIKIDEEIMVNRSEKELLIGRLELRLLKLWKGYKEIIEEYLDYSKRILKYSNVLKDKVKADDQLIADQKMKLSLMQGMIDTYKLETNMEPKNAELRDLRAERLQLYTTYTNEKKRIDEAQHEYDRRIHHLINSNMKIKVYLEGVMKKGEKINTLAKLCGKFETEKEKLKDVSKYGGEQRTNFKMARFWKRVGRVSLVKRLINLEKLKLKEENQMMKREMVRVFNSGQLQQVLSDLTQCSQ